MPWLLIGFATAGTFAWDYYQFGADPNSELNMERGRIEEIRGDIKRKTEKLLEVEEFRKTVDQRKQQLFSLASRLNERKQAVSDKLDVADFMSLISTEAKRVGLDVVSLEPNAMVTKELYAEHPFKLVFRGVYVQFLVFLERVANLQKIVRIDRFEVKPSSSANLSRSLVQLEGNMELKVYRYVSSAADSLPAEFQTAQSGGSLKAPPSQPAVAEEPKQENGGEQ